MVLNLADLGKCRKSLQTPSNASYILENTFVTGFGVVAMDFGWIREGRKVADFEQKPWAIGHGFEHGGFWQVLEIAPNSLKRLLHPWKYICNWFWGCSYGFWVNSEGSESGRFWAKTLGYRPWFWTWRILVSAGNRSKLSETPPKCLKMDF